MGPLATGLGLEIIAHPNIETHGRWQPARLQLLARLRPAFLHWKSKLQVNRIEVATQGFITSDSTTTAITGTSPATALLLHYRSIFSSRGNPMCFGIGDCSIRPGHPAQLSA